MTKLCLTLAALLYCLLIVLALRPAFDLEVARGFYRGAGHFVGLTPAGKAARYTAWALPFVILTAMVGAALLGRAGLLAARWVPRGRSLLFMALSLAIAPGLVVHGILKEVSHRPRPTSLTEFGGADVFRPFTRFDGACRHNCSFPSGGTAATTWTLAPASLVPPPWRGAALVIAVVFAAGTGLLRIASGGHFLSDVGGAALITILVVLAFRHAIASKAPRVPMSPPDETGPSLPVGTDHHR